MKKVGEILTAMIVDESTFYKLSDVKRLDQNSLIEELIEQGIIATHRVQGETQIDLATLLRLQKAMRLHQDLEINAPGIAVIFDLMDELESMQQQLALVRIQIK